jgi:hypothetical protein
MPNSLQRTRIVEIEMIGEDAIFDGYIETGSMRGMMKRLGIKNWRALYQWLRRDEGRWQRWQDTLEARSYDAVDRISDIADEVTPENASAKSVELRAVTALTEKLNPRFRNNTQVNVGVSVDAGSDWLKALREMQSPPQQIMPVEIVTEEGTDE